jgi:Flp pilus assembly pilin Flp
LVETKERAGLTVRQESLVDVSQLKGKVRDPTPLADLQNLNVHRLRNERLGRVESHGKRKSKGDWMINAIKQFLKDERAMQTGEYMILGTVMGAGSIGAIKTVRDGQVEKFQELSAALDTAPDGTIGGP